LYKYKNEEIYYFLLQLKKVNNDKFIVLTKNEKHEHEKSKTTKGDAFTHFKQIFEKKTGNVYGETFVKKTDKYGIEFPDTKQDIMCMPLTLQPDLLWLINLLSDENSIKTALSNLNIDTNLMPIDKITSQRVEKADTTLNEIKTLLDNNNESKIEELSFNYYLYMPYTKKDKLGTTQIVDKHIDNDSSKNNDNGYHKKDMQTVDTLLRNADKIDKFLAENEKRIGQSKQKKEVQSNITDNESCKMTTSKGTIQGMTCVTAADAQYASRGRL
jgi:hypothetical protein